MLPLLLTLQGRFIDSILEMGKPSLPQAGWDSEVHARFAMSRLSSSVICSQALSLLLPKQNPVTGGEQVSQLFLLVRVAATLRIDGHLGGHCDLTTQAWLPRLETGHSLWLPPLTTSTRNQL